MTTNDHGEYDQLVHVVFSALKEIGVARLKSRHATALSDRPKTTTTTTHDCEGVPPDAEV